MMIGFITSAVWSPKASAYVGIGYCLSTLLSICLEEQNSGRNCLVLTADENRKQGCFVRLTLCCHVCSQIL